mgnify:CR=1 FL=1
MPFESLKRTKTRYKEGSGKTFVRTTWVLQKERTELTDYVISDGIRDGDINSVVLSSSVIVVAAIAGVGRIG